MVGGEADLWTTLMVSPRPPSVLPAGGTLTLNAQYGNKGPAPADNVEVSLGSSLNGW